MITIAINFDGFNIAVHPDPAVCDRREYVRWEVHAQNHLLIRRAPIQILDWLIYFDDGSPFLEGVNRFKLQTIASHSSGQHYATTQGIAAKKPGDWKYGI